MDKSEKLGKLNAAIDNLTLDMLSLLEKNLESNIYLEQAVKDGNYHLAKARYIMGHKNVSTLQLPNEDSPEVKPMTVVQQIEADETNGESKTYELKVNNTPASRAAEETEDPMKWFGILVPKDLRQAQLKFINACQQATEVANIKNQFDAVSKDLLFAINVKDELKKE